ncbi:MAG: RNA 2',3'-cyclic phosphodiesterase [Desulfuromonadaceae bacterium]|nr:RNA 2',3'-cyclic phosphodiesterase [Desulfuromonadaceae bacterium]
MRLFIAIKIPDNIKMAIGSLRVDIPGARWVPAEQIHLTLAFLGEVKEVVAGGVTEELGRIQLPEFILHFSGTGCFPDRHRPRVLWIGVQPHPHLQALAAMVRTAVLACDIPQEERPFSPHITLVRLKPAPSREFDAFLDRNKNLTFPPFRVREFTLFQSILTQQGALHIPVRNYPLAAADVVSGL